MARAVWAVGVTSRAGVRCLEALTQRLLVLLDGIAATIPAGSGPNVAKAPDALIRRVHGAGVARERSCVAEPRRELGSNVMAMSAEQPSKFLRNLRAEVAARLATLEPAVREYEELTAAIKELAELPPAGARTRETQPQLSRQRPRRRTWGPPRHLRPRALRAGRSSHTSARAGKPNPASRHLPVTGGGDPAAEVTHTVRVEGPHPTVRHLPPASRQEAAADLTPAAQGRQNHRAACRRRAQTAPTRRGRRCPVHAA